MGFNVTVLAQKARTATLIVDSDLDMGEYDVIATDIKGDTAEFTEFVGGVGNFESGLISGGLDVDGAVTGARFNGLKLKHQYNISPLTDVAGIWISESTTVPLFSLPVGCYAEGTISIRKTFEGNARLVGINDNCYPTEFGLITNTSTDYVNIDIKYARTLYIDVSIYTSEGGLYWKCFNLI